MNTYRIWRDDGEEWPAEGEPEPLGDYEGATPTQAAEAAAAEVDLDDGATFFAHLVGTDRYYEIKLNLSWQGTSESLDIDSIREAK